MRHTAPSRLLQWGRGLKTPEIHLSGFRSGRLRRRFNGAGVLRPRKFELDQIHAVLTHVLQWGRGLKTPEIGAPPEPYNPEGECFNGAGVLRPRKFHVAAPLCPHLLWLQWGRGLKTPEMLCEGHESPICRRASMGPGS